MWSIQWVLHPRQYIVTLQPPFQKKGKSKFTKMVISRMERPLDLLMALIEERFQIRVLCLFISRCLAKPRIYVVI